MLGELGDPRAIDALRAVAVLPVKLNRDRNSQMMLHRAREALAKFDAPALVPTWIELLNGQWDLPAEQLAKLGDRRALAPLREHALNSDHVASAKALAELGDDSVIRFMRWDALRSTDPDNASTWGGSKALRLLLPGERWEDRLRHEHPAARYHALGAASREGRIDVLVQALEHADVAVRREAVRRLADWYNTLDDDEPGEHAMRIDALKRALSVAEPDIRRTAASGLAQAGDDSGEASLRADLHATDYATRRRARAGLLNLRGAR
jgi:HEAT repeat protein